MFSFLRSTQKRVYLDNAGATHISKQSQDALIASLATYGNASGIHKEGVEAGNLLDKARGLCASTLNAHGYEIYFASSGTESCNIAILGTYNAHQKASTNTPHIITSTIEHPSVLEPIRHLERTGKARVTYIPVSKEGIVRVQDIREALSEDTILVSIMYANNEIGTILPIKEIGRAIDEWKRENGRTFNEYPYLHTDACQAANYLNLDVVRLKCHLMTVNGSKCYGPKGTALLYKREGLRLGEVLFGGGQERGLRSGTENAPSLYAFGVALREAYEMRERESARLRDVRDYAYEELQKSIQGITFYGAWDEYTSYNGARVLHDEKRLPNNINCRIPGISSDEMIIRLDAKGFAVSHKSACASSETDGSYVIEALGAFREEALQNIRITLGRDTTKGDMDALVRAMKEIQEQFAIL